MSRDIELALIDPDPDQPRRQFDAARVAELAQSLAADGLINPILVRPIGERYLLVAGERRWRAAQQLNWTTIAADVRDLDADAARWLQLAENIQRQDLTPIEEAQALRAHLNDGMTQAAIGARISKSQSHVAQKLRLLQMPMFLQILLGRGLLTEGHCRQLLRLDGMCRDIITPMPNWEAARRSEGETDHALLLGILPALRLEDQPPAYFALFATVGKLPDDNPRLGGLGAATDAWLASIMTRRGQMPYWERAAFWWAVWTVGLDMSVHHLHHSLDQWERRWRSAILWQALDAAGAPPSGQRPNPQQVSRESFARIAAPDWQPTLNDYYALEVIAWWGHRSDVRHGDIEAVLAHPHGQGIALETAMDLDAFCLPSAMQSWGQQKREGDGLRMLENGDAA